MKLDFQEEVFRVITSFTANEARGRKQTLHIVQRFLYMNLDFFWKLKVRVITKISSKQS